MQHEAAMKLQRELHAEMEQNLRKGLTANNRPFDEATVCHFHPYLDQCIKPAMPHLCYTL